MISAIIFYFIFSFIIVILACSCFKPGGPGKG